MAASVESVLGKPVKVVTKETCYVGILMNADTTERTLTLRNVTVGEKGAKGGQLDILHLKRSDILDLDILDARHARGKTKTFLTRKKIKPKHLEEMRTREADDELGILQSGQPLKQVSDLKKSEANGETDSQDGDYILIDSIDEDFHDAIAAGDLVYVFDILTIGKEAFSQGLGAIFSHPNILKVIHDCRQPSDILFHQFNVDLRNVFDTQVGDIFIDKMQHEDYWPRYAQGLATCLLQYLPLQPSEVNMARTRQHCFEDETVWTERPCYLLEEAIKDVIHLRTLRRMLTEKMMKEYTNCVDIYLNHSRRATELQARSHTKEGHLVPHEFQEISDNKTWKERTRYGETRRRRNSPDRLASGENRRRSPERQSSGEEAGRRGSMLTRRSPERPGATSGPGRGSINRSGPDRGFNRNGPGRNGPGRNTMDRNGPDRNGMDRNGPDRSRPDRTSLDDNRQNDSRSNGGFTDRINSGEGNNHPQNGASQSDSVVTNKQSVMDESRDLNGEGQFSDVVNGNAGDARPGQQDGTAEPTSTAPTNSDNPKSLLAAAMATLTISEPSNLIIYPNTPSYNHVQAIRNQIPPRSRCNNEESNRHIDESNTNDSRDSNAPFCDANPNSDNRSNFRNNSDFRNNVNNRGGNRTNNARYNRNNLPQNNRNNSSQYNRNSQPNDRGPNNYHNHNHNQQEPNHYNNRNIGTTSSYHNRQSQRNTEANTVGTLRRDQQSVSFHKFGRKSNNFE